MSVQPLGVQAVSVEPLRSVPIVSMKAHIGVANGTDSGSGDQINVGYQTNGWYKLSTHPLYFTRAGYLWSDEHRLAATNLLYWSATSYVGSNAYDLFAYSSGLYPAGRDNRGYGFSVRCVTGLSSRNKNVIIKLAQPLGNCAIELLDQALMPNLFSASAKTNVESYPYMPYRHTNSHQCSFLKLLVTQHHRLMKLHTRAKYICAVDRQTPLNPENTTRTHYRHSVE